MIYDDKSRKRSRSRVRAERPDPADGEEIRLSTRAAVWTLIGCTLWFLWGVGLLVLVLRAVYLRIFDDTPFPEGSNPIVAVLIMLSGLFGAPAFAQVMFRKMRRGRRIVIAADCFQIVEGHEDDTQVCVSIPFENIEELKCTRVDFGYRLDFELIDTHDPDTYLPGIDIEENYCTANYHFAVAETYQEPPRELEYLINRARKRWRKKQKAKDDDA